MSFALVRSSLVTKASTLVKLKFYFPRVGGSRDPCLGAKSPRHQGCNPGEIKILFSKGVGKGHYAICNLNPIKITVIKVCICILDSSSKWFADLNPANSCISQLCICRAASKHSKILFCLYFNFYK